MTKFQHIDLIRTNHCQYHHVRYGVQEPYFLIFFSIFHSLIPFSRTMNNDDCAHLLIALVDTIAEEFDG